MINLIVILDRRSRVQTHLVVVFVAGYDGSKSIRWNNPWQKKKQTHEKPKLKNFIAIPDTPNQMFYSKNI